MKETAFLEEKHYKAEIMEMKNGNIKWKYVMEIHNIEDKINDINYIFSLSLNKCVA